MSCFCSVICMDGPLEWPEAPPTTVTTSGMLSADSRSIIWLCRALGFSGGSANLCFSSLRFFGLTSTSLALSYALTAIGPIIRFATLESP